MYKISFRYDMKTMNVGKAECKEMEMEGKENNGICEVQ